MQRLTQPRFLLLALACLAGGAHGQATSNPNQIVGELGFTNTNPAILNILESTGLDQGLSLAFLSADSVGVTPPLNNNTNFSIGAPNRVTSPYSITVEAGPGGAGIEYAVRGTFLLDGNFDSYVSETVHTVPPHVEEEPADDAVVSLLECAGMLDIKWQDRLGNPVTVSGGSVTALLESTPGSGSFNSFQASAGIPNGVSQTYLAVRGERDFRVDITFTSGTDPFSNQITSVHQAFVFVRCDEIVEICCLVDGAGPPGGLGEIVGIVDMLCEDEHQIGNRTLMRADSGPFGNFRFDTVPGFPSQGPFQLENLVPSDAVSPSRGYRVYGDMNFRLDRRFEYFQTPLMENVGNNSRVDVFAGMTTDLGLTFVMDPGYVVGDLLFAGPPASASPSGSCLADISRDSDFATAGIPNDINLNRSRVEASGSSTASPGSFFNAFGGSARVLFEGDFNTTTDDFEGDYELVLGGLSQETSRWTVNRYSLRFEDLTTPAAAESYQNSRLQVIDNTLPSLDVVPKTTQELDFAQCYSQVNLGFVATAGTVDFFNPRVTSSSGAFNGIDFQGNAADYQVLISSANGTPNSSAAAAATGLVVMCLPQGSYTFTPFITAINPGGGTSNTELPPVTLDVGCRQIIDLTSDLQVTITTQIPGCVDEEVLTVEGLVNGANTINRVFYTLNGGPEVDVCTACGLDPVFSFDVILEDCSNEISVRAVDALGTEASVTTFTRFDSEAPVIDCPADLTVAATEPGGIPIGLIPLPTSATDNCDGLVDVTCEPNLVLVPPGTTTFVCTASDQCGNMTECQFDVTVTIPIGTNYCDPAVPNSTNQSGKIEATGSVSLLANSVTLTASCLPPDQFGFFLAGPGNGTFAPANSCGIFCLKGGDPGLLGRYSGAVFNSGSTGTGSLTLDLTMVPIAGQGGAPPFTIALTAGTWNFQCWYRDAQGCAQGNNFTSAIAITFVDP